MSAEEASEVKHVSTSRSSRLRQEREQRGWTQIEVAEHISSPRVNISRWENGITVPSPYYRQRLAELFGKSIQELGFIPDSSQERDEPPISGIASSHPSTLPQPIWNVPYRRNPFFTGREAILTHLDTVLRSSKAAALTQAQAISGLGGIGKTQIAVEYAYRYRGYYQAIFWMDASSREALSNHFFLLAALLELPEQHEQDIIVQRAVKHWLTTHGDWLLILDNVDNPEIITDFLPVEYTGVVLLTTRLQALGTVAQSIEVEQMGQDEGKKFLLRRIKLIAPEAPLEQATKEDREQAAEVVKALDGLPLALDQAGAYIEETRCGLLEYLSLFETRRKDLLLRRGRFPLDHPTSVATTWSLSFQQVEQESPAAAELLCFLAFLNPEAVPKEIITLGAGELGTTLEAVASDPLQLDRMIEVLLHYSLIRRTPKSDSLSIHRLVQAVLRDGMENSAQRVWTERAIRAVNQTFLGIGEQQTWKESQEGYQRCLPHVQMGAAYSKNYSIAIPEAARLFNEASFYFVMHARHQQAESLLLEALAIHQRIIGTNLLDVARTLSDLGEVYRYQGKYSEAGSSLDEALKIRLQLLGKEHPDVAQTLSRLAELYRTRGDYGEAERHYVRAQQIREKAFGMDTPLIAESYYGLARLYYSQGKYQRAEQFCDQALRIQERHLGSSHPVIASTLSVLAKIYQEQHKLNQAEEVNKRALKMRESTSGEDHPNVATILNNLVEIYHIEGRYGEAQPLIARSLRIHEQVLGSEHPFRAYSLSNWAENFFLQGDYVQAEEFYKKALAIRKQHLGEAHPHTASIYYHLAKLYITLERFEEAEQFASQALAIREHAFGVDHPAFASVLEQEITLLRKLKRESEVCEVEARIKKIRATQAARDGP